MNSAQTIEALKNIPDVEFESILNSLWYKYPPELVRDELVRRLKLRNDLTFDEKKLKYKEIVDRFRIIGNSKSFDSFLTDLAEIDDGSVEKFQRFMDSSKSRSEAMNEHFRQLVELHSKLDDPFEGKNKPGDWRPEGAELCPVCDGNGKGADGRMCKKCSGRGFITRSS